MGVTYVGGTIYVDGYSEAVFCDAQEVYDEDVAQGWGVVYKQGNNQFYFDANLSINVNAWFADTNKQIEFAPGKTLTINEPGGHYRLGEVDVEAKQTGKNGCNIIFHPSSSGQRMIYQYDNSEFELYNSQIILESAGNNWGYLDLSSEDTYKFRVWGSRLAGGAYVWLRGVYATGKYGFARTDVEDWTYGLFVGGNWGDTFFYDTRIMSCGTGFYFFMTGGIVVSNLVIANCPTMITLLNSSGDHIFVDCECDNWTISGIGNAIVYRQHKFNKNIIDELKAPYAGKPWTLQDKDDVTQHSGNTQATGNLATTDVAVTHVYYDSTGSHPMAPYSLWVDGETDYLDLDELDLDMDSKNINGELTMVKVSDIVDSITDMKGSGFVKDTHSLVNIEERTTNLPDDPADQSQVEAVIATRAPAGEYDVPMGYIPSDMGDVPTDSELDGKHGAGSWEGVPGSTDWSPDERKQIRDALGVDGDKENSVGGVMQKLKKIIEAILGAVG